MKIVIIGGVAGGATAAARLRRLDESAQIIILERSGYVSYANCGLPYYIGGVIQDKNALTLQTKESFWRRFRIDVRVNQEAESIDREAKTVSVKNLETGENYTESYDKLILSPGASAIKPPMKGIDLPGIFTLRTVENTFEIKNFVDNRKPETAVVVGGGFIGLEMAENLMHLGLKVTLLQRENQVMLPLDYDMACQIHGYLRRQGMDLRLSQTVEGFESAGSRLKVFCKGSQPMETDLVIMAAGVAPETHLAKDAGLKLGIRNSILVNDRMETSDPNIYAVGDAVQVNQLVTEQPALISLAGPANKQGRIAADNICGGDSRYRGSLGSSVLKLFDMTVASVGLNTRSAQDAGISVGQAVTFSASHAGYYPGATDMTIKTLFDQETGEIIGAQIVGFEGVDKRIDVLATAIRGGMTAADLEELELAYAPPYSSAKDPVNMAGFVIENQRRGLVDQYDWQELEAIGTEEGPSRDQVILLDARTPEEYAQGHVEGAVNIPVDELRQHLEELDKEKTIYVYCYSGLRSYIACRILTGNGFTCRNLAGGWRFYSQVLDDRSYDETPRYDCGVKI